MTLKKRRGLRALGTVCAAATILATIPVGTAFAADPYPTPSPSSSPQGDPKLIEALEKAPELKGATFDVSGVTLETGKATATNEKYTPNDHIFYDHDLANPVRKMKNGKAQPDEPFTSVSASKAHTDTFTSTRTHDFSFGVTMGYSYSTGVEVGIDSTSTTTTHTYKAEFNFTYKYGMQETVSKSDTATITSSAQTMLVPPGYRGRIRQWVDIGTYEADITIPGTLRGDVIVTKCGTPVRVPIGRLASMKRDDGQGLLFPNTSADGDVLRQSATVHWQAYIAASCTTRSHRTSRALSADGAPAPIGPATSAPSHSGHLTTKGGGSVRNPRPSR